ncbi:MAG: class I SAM-dependent methyltransferase [Acidobacteriota bacterium]
MNHLRIKNIAIKFDEHRPQDDFWGPVRITGDLAQPDISHQSDPLQSKPDECPICSSAKTSFLLNVYGWPIYECENCGVGFVWPQPSNELLEKFYDAEYWSHYMGSEEPLYFRAQLTSHIFSRQAQCFDRIMNGHRRARVLDIGAGDGTMLRLLTDIGYRDVYGVDLNETNARRAREHLNVNVEACDFLTFHEKGWDAITLWAVIEHLKDPVSYLRHARTLLNPGGTFILMTGDNSSAQAWIQGALDMWVYPPEHLFYFTRRSLRHLFEQAGYTDFRAQLQFQPKWKESLLWGIRMLLAAKTRLNPNARFWRSVNSNLLVAWGTPGTAKS